MRKLAFYCVCDARHFLGLVALINSLRTLGHDEPVYVLDCGFQLWQHEVLARDGEIVVVQAESSWHPMLLKTVLPLAYPAEAMVVVDVDVIFTQRVDALVRTAVTTAKPIFFPDSWIDRFDAAWEALGFGPPVPHDYVASGQFVLPAESGRDFLVLWAQALERLASNPSLARPWLPKDQDPFHFPDMDVLNALIGPAIPLDSFVLAEVETAAYPPFDGLRLVDSEELLVTYADGTQPTILHHFLEKPWNARVAPNVYSRLMTRLLFGSDLALRVPRGRVRYSLRPGVSGAAARGYDVFRLATHRTVRGRLGIRKRLARRLPAARASGIGG